MSTDLIPYPTGFNHISRQSISDSDPFVSRSDTAFKQHFRDVKAKSRIRPYRFVEQYLMKTNIMNNFIMVLIVSIQGYISQGGIWIYIED